MTTDQLIVTLRKPYKRASKDIIRRSIKDIFTMNNSVNFSSRSCPVSSSNKEKYIDADINEKNRKNVFKCYDREITEYPPDS